MYRKIALAGATAAAIIGVGTAAIAASGPSSTGGTGASAAGKSTTTTKHATGQKQGANQRLRVLRRAVHGSIVTKSKDGYVTHTAVRGAVTSVSATSITVKAADGYSQSFTLGKATKVREHSAGAKKLTAGTIADLKTGDKVAVVGRGADKAGVVPTATVVLDGVK